MQIVRQSELLYFRKGHTHGPLDGTFGQLCTKLHVTPFDDDLDVVELLQTFVLGMGIDEGSRKGGLVYKLDEAADWETWWQGLPFDLSNLTGPEAPHYFRICHRRDIGLGSPNCSGNEESKAPRSAWPGAPEPALHDVVMVVKSRISSLKVLQVVTLVPECEVRALRLRTQEPQGVHPRRQQPEEKQRKKIFRVAEVARDRGTITSKACDYLQEWARGVLLGS